MPSVFPKNMKEKSKKKIQTQQNALGKQDSFSLLKKKRQGGNPLAHQAPCDCRVKTVP